MGFFYGCSHPCCASAHVAFFEGTRESGQMFPLARGAQFLFSFNASVLFVITVLAPGFVVGIIIEFVFKNLSHLF